MTNKKLLLVIAVTVIICTGIVGCGKTAAFSNNDKDKVISETQSQISLPENSETSSQVSLSGPFGEMKLTLLDGWKYELCENGSEVAKENGLGQYGISFSPDDISKGYIYVTYCTAFGVCGTGLEEEHIKLAGVEAIKGTYDNAPYWDFISFAGDKEGIVAQTYDVSDWSIADLKQAEKILDSLKWDPSKKANTVSQTIESSEGE